MVDHQTDIASRTSHPRDTAPFFSVVIPVYNRARVVGRSVDSVLNQTFSDFEIVIVDDGSSDDIAAAIAFYDDSRIRFVRQPNRGASAARNHGIDLAAGRFVAFLDSDDSFLPHHLGAMAALLRGRDDHVGYAPVRAQRGTGYIVKPPRAIAPAETMAHYLMCARGFVQTSGLVVPLRAARSVRYREDVSFGDDTDFAIRLQLAGYRFVMAETASVDWFDGPDPGRLSNAPLDDKRLRWLDDLRPLIPANAYFGYKGWHVAKSLFPTRPVLALGLYARALFAGSYDPILAVTVLAQLVFPRWLYRYVADRFIGMRNRDPIPAVSAQ